MSTGFTSSERPMSSENMKDLHIYVVPLSLWDEQQNLAFNQMINATISAGFIRVEPGQYLFDIRREIDDQLGEDAVPEDYMFCKSVGRCLALVRDKQENQLKVKHFLPPNSYSPELFVVDSIVSKQNIKSRSNSQRQMPMTSESNNFKSDESINEEERIPERKKTPVSDRNEKPKNVKQLPPIDHNSQESLDPELAKRRKEIEQLQDEINKRHDELKTLELEHEQKIKEWEEEEAKRKKMEEERQRQFEQMERERQEREREMIAKQKEELEKLEKLVEEKKIEISETEEKLEKEREERQHTIKSKMKEIEELKTDEPPNPDQNTELIDRMNKLHAELEEIDKKHKELEETAEKERQQAEAELERAEKEFQNLKLKWDDERKNQEKEFAERMAEEERLREMAEQKRKEHEQKMEEERRRLLEARERFEEEQKQWEEEQQRYYEEEQLRADDINQAINEAVANKPVVPNLDIHDPDLIVPDNSDVDQKTHLKNVLNSVKGEREAAEKERENAIKHIRTHQMKIQNRRSQLRDIWKKKYLEEKRKTPPLEDQLNKYKHELEALYKKMMSMMEAGFRDNNRKFTKTKGILNPSDKANMILQAIRLQHEIDDLNQKVEYSQLRLNAEKKLREQTVAELKILRIEATQNKIQLTKTRSDQLAVLPYGELPAIPSSRPPN